MVNAAMWCSRKTCLRGMCWKNCSRMVHSHKKISGCCSGQCFCIGAAGYVVASTYVCSRWQGVCFACDLIGLALGCWRSLPSPSFGSGSVFSEQVALIHDFMAEGGTLWMSVQENSSARISLLVMLGPFVVGRWEG